MIDLALVEPGMTLTYFLGPGRPYGYDTRRTNQILVKAHCKTEKRVKCEFVTSNGRTVHRWLSPANLSFAQWTSNP